VQPTRGKRGFEIGWGMMMGHNDDADDSYNNKIDVTRCLLTP